MALSLCKRSCGQTGTDRRIACGGWQHHIDSLLAGIAASWQQGGIFQFSERCLGYSSCMATTAPLCSENPEGPSIALAECDGRSRSTDPGMAIAPGKCACGSGSRARRISACDR